MHRIRVRVHSRERWSITLRLIKIGAIFIVAQAVINNIIGSHLTKKMLTQYLQASIQEELRLPMSKIENKLDQIPEVDTLRCCSQSDYELFLEDLSISSGKVFIIAGGAGIVPIQGSMHIYSSDTLAAYSAKAISSKERMYIDWHNKGRPISATAIKISGGSNTGYLVYVRPIDGIQFVNALSSLRILTSSFSLLLLSVGFVASLVIALKPLNQIGKEISSIQWNDLAGKGLALDKQPDEMLPLIESFNEMTKRLAVSSENQKHFASTISHEFRTPLTVISGFIQSVLNRSSSLSMQERAALETADKETLRINRMLSDLLDLSRADNNQLGIKQESFDVIEATDYAIKISQGTCGNPIIGPATSEIHLYAVGDEDRYIQCVKNLIGNASKFSKVDSPIKIDIVARTDSIAVNVIDKGQGIPKSQQERIFQRFVRAEGVVQQSGTTSSGLGLSIVQMLVKAMGGEIYLESEPGKGSTFTILMRRDASGAKRMTRE